MKCGIFFNHIESLSKKRAIDSIMSLSDIFKLVWKNEQTKAEINENNIHLIVTSLRYYIFERKPTDAQMSWEIIVAKNMLEAPQLEKHLKKYLGIDITDEEMADSVFGKSQSLTMRLT